MRILHVGSGNLFGGIETLLLTLARSRHLCPDMEPHFAFSFEGRISNEISNAGAPVYQLGEVRSSRPWSVMRARRNLKSLIETEAFDVVVCHGQWVLAIFGPPVNYASKLVFWMHDWTNGRGWIDWWDRATHPDLVIGNSKYTTSSLPKLFRNVPSKIINCPVNLEAKTAPQNSRAITRRELGASDNDVVILQVSRMEAWKGHLLHLNALSLLGTTAPWQCWIVGGPQRDKERLYQLELQKVAAEFGISDKVKFLGQSSNVPSILAAADIFCQPNRNPEPFGIVFIEALLAGLPIVSTAMGGALEIVDSSCGVLIPAGDAQALSECLRCLIASPERRTYLGQSGPTRARDLCDPESQLRKVFRAFEEVAIPHRNIADRCLPLAN